MGPSSLIGTQSHVALRATSKAGSRSILISNFVHALAHTTSTTASRRRAHGMRRHFAGRAPKSTYEAGPNRAGRQRHQTAASPEQRYIIEPFSSWLHSELHVPRCDAPANGRGIPPAVRHASAL